MIYIRQFDSKFIEEYEDIPKYLKWSRYFKTAFYTSLYKINDNDEYVINDNHYIVCPLYKRRNKWDFQIGVTGSIKEYESNESALIRELAEEVGLTPQKSRFFDIYDLDNIYEVTNDKDDIIVVYMTDIENLKNLKEKDVKTDINTAKDTKNKIGCIVYGEENYIYDFLRNDIYRHADNECIKGVAAISVRTIREKFSQLSWLGRLLKKMNIKHTIQNFKN